MDWKQALMQVSNPPISKERLRSGEERIRISRIAKQYYCELKLHLACKLEQAGIKTPGIQALRGKPIHERMREKLMEQIQVEDLIRDIERGERMICNFPVYAQLDGVVIEGIPDGIVFERGIPQILIKIKIGSNTRIHRSQLVQANLYCYCLDCMGFRTEGMRYWILKLRKQGILDGIQIGKMDRDRLRERILSMLMEMGDREFRDWIRKNGMGEIYSRRYSRKNAKRDLDWALGYWRNLRNPIPTKSLGRCRRCELGGLCPEKQAEYWEDWEDWEESLEKRIGS